MRVAAMAMSAAIAGATLVAAGARPAHACSVAYPPHALDPTEQAVDTQPPGPPEVSGMEILRTANSGCANQSSCADLGSVRVAIGASDDRTPAALLGYRIAISGRKVPAGLPALGEDIRVQGSGQLTFFFIDDPAKREEIDFVLQFQTVDLAGNVSLGTTTVTVRHPDDDAACAVGGRGGGRLGWAATAAAVLGMAMALAMRRRPRRHRGTAVRVGGAGPAADGAMSRNRAAPGAAS